MFTGLVKCLGCVEATQGFGKGARFRIGLGGLAEGVAVGQSVAVNGVCLTATTVDGNAATFDAVKETVARSNLGRLKKGDMVNLEPALRVGDALDGHFLLGHVDAVAAVLEVDGKNPDNRRIEIELPENIRHLVAEKGSIAIDGISLTVASAGAGAFSVAVIPHSWKNSTLGFRKTGDLVNLEADVLARYAARIMEYRPQAASGISEDFLRQNGFA